MFYRAAYLRLPIHILRRCRSPEYSLHRFLTCHKMQLEFRIPLPYQGLIFFCFFSREMKIHNTRSGDWCGSILCETFLHPSALPVLKSCEKAIYMGDVYSLLLTAIR